MIFLEVKKINKKIEYKRQNLNDGTMSKTAIFGKLNIV